MKSLVYKAPGMVAVEERGIPSSVRGNVLIKVCYAGICGSDISIASGKHPRAKPSLIMGHEFTGIISEIETNKYGLKKDDRVLIFPTIKCGACLACRTGHENVCNTLEFIGIDTDGGMAEYASVPIEKLLLIPEGLDYDVATLIEPLACIVHCIRESAAKFTDNVLISGAGPIGLLTGLVLKTMGILNIFVTEIDEYRLSMCRELGLKTIDVKAMDPVAFIKEQTNGEGADILFEASGASQSAVLMTELVRSRGQLVILSIFKQPASVDLRAVNFKEINIIGSRAYTKDEFIQAMKYATHIKKDLAKLISHRVPLKEGNKAFELIGAKGANALKVLIDCH